MATRRITGGTGNVFGDFGYADAAERQTKLGLVHAIGGVIARWRLAQTTAAAKMGGVAGFPRIPETGTAKK